MPYIDGFLVAVPTANKDAYKALAGSVVELFREFGVARFVETWGDDVPEGKVTDMRRAVKATADETVVFSWFEYPDKATRDAAGEKMRTDPRMENMGQNMPFDGMRMIYGGFEVILDEGRGGAAGYVDGSVAPAAAGAREIYRAYSARMTARLLELGALRCLDAWSDDTPRGKVTDFQGAVAAEDGEAMIFSWVEWPSKAVRDAAWPQIMSDPALAPSHDEAAAVDNHRRIYGGFVPILDA